MFRLLFTTPMVVYAETQYWHNNGGSPDPTGPVPSTKHPWYGTFKPFFQRTPGHAGGPGGQCHELSFSEGHAPASPGSTDPLEKGVVSNEDVSQNMSVHNALFELMMQRVTSLFGGPLGDCQANANDLISYHVNRLQEYALLDRTSAETQILTRTNTILSEIPMNQETVKELDTRLLKFVEASRVPATRFIEFHEKQRRRYQRVPRDRAPRRHAAPEEKTEEAGPSGPLPTAQFTLDKLNGLMAPEAAALGLDLQTYRVAVFQEQFRKLHQKYKEQYPEWNMSAEIRVIGYYQKALHKLPNGKLQELHNEVHRLIKDGFQL